MDDIVQGPPGYAGHRFEVGVGAEDVDLRKVPAKGLSNFCAVGRRLGIISSSSSSIVCGGRFAFAKFNGSLLDGGWNGRRIISAVAVTAAAAAASCSGEGGCEGDVGSGHRYHHRGNPCCAN